MKAEIKTYDSTLFERFKDKYDNKFKILGY